MAALIAADRYVDAARYVEPADVGRQLAYDGGGHLGVSGVGQYAPGAPGAGPAWTFPGTSDARIDDAEDRWNRAATEFARCYNLRRDRRGIR